MMSRLARRSIAVCGLAAAALALIGPMGAAAAQTQAAGCPIVDDGTVSDAVGSPVAGKVDGTSGAVVLCSFNGASERSFGVSRELGAFGPSDGGAAGLASRYIPGLPDVAKNQINALSQAGINITLPDYQFESVSGVGDSALWVKTQLTPGVFRDSLLVQRGGDGFSFDVDDSPDARSMLVSLAQAILAQS